MIPAEPRARLRQLLVMARAMLPALAEAALPVTEDYDATRADLVNRLTDAFVSFASTNGRAARNEARRALQEDIPAAFYRGYEDAGGEETDDDDEAWLDAKLAEQQGYLADALTAIRGQGDAVTEPGLTARAEMWGNTLDAVYTQGKLRGAKNKMLTWRLGNTEKHCTTCLKLNGQRHSAKWWLKRNYIPGQPGSETLECGGWNCDCGLEDDDGNMFTFEAQ